MPLVSDCAAAGDKKDQVTFRKAKLELGQKRLTVELAENDEQRQQGLMHRKSLEDGYGMLFIFPQQRVLTFWMKNTLLPLSIGYFDKDQKLVTIVKMNPESPMVLDENLKRYPSVQPAKYALEVPQGWFDSNNIKTGSVFKLTRPKSTGSKSSQ
ncbi:MAG: DUF192 domain-containing protein [Bdellovibrionales bacterium]|nr:DUF192 domain-containing protein [Bdellovibrionales bacterium]